MVVTVPEEKVSQLPEDLFEGVGDRVVVIDTGNYYPRHRDGRIDAIKQGVPESMWVARGSSVGRWSRLSTTSTPSICATTADRLAPLAGSRCPSPR